MYIRSRVKQGASHGPVPTATHFIPYTPGSFAAERGGSDMSGKGFDRYHTPALAVLVAALGETRKCYALLNSCICLHTNEIWHHWHVEKNHVASQ